jgi:hypothetical protein
MAGKRHGLKNCSREQETIGYQSELVGVENSLLVYFSPVRSKKVCFIPNRFRGQKIQMAHNNLLLNPTYRFEFWHQRCLHRGPSEDTHFLSFRGIFSGWNEIFQKAFADILLQRMFPKPKM